MNKITIESMSPDYKYEYFTINKITWLDTYVSSDFNITSADICALFDAATPNDFKTETNNAVLRICAKVGDKIVGISESFRMRNTPKHIYIRTIYVLPEFQRNGIGKMLLSFIQNYFHDWNQISLETATYNQRAINFYLKTGFTIDPEWIGSFNLSNNKSIPLVRLVYSRDNATSNTQAVSGTSSARMS